MLSKNRLKLSPAEIAERHNSRMISHKEEKVHRLEEKLKKAQEELLVLQGASA